MLTSRRPRPLAAQADKKTKEEKVEERVTLGPKVAEGENVFGVAHIFASFNDTFVVSAASNPILLLCCSDVCASFRKSTW